MTGHEYMKAIQKVRRNINLLHEQIEREYALASGVTAIQYDRDKIQTSPVSDRMVNIVANIMEHVEEMQEELSKLQKMEEEARHYLLQLDEKYERALALHYLHGKPWPWVANMIGFHEKYIYQVKEDALDALTKIINNQ